MSPRRSNPAVERPIHRSAAARLRGNRVFYVAVEGESTEPDYLGHLNREFGAELQFIIYPLYRRNGMTPAQVVRKALEHQADLQADGDRVQLWALFDHDQHRDIPQAMREAAAGGVRVALSHPSFDLWLLLHFTDVSGQQAGSSRIVHEKLRQHDGFAAFDSRNDKSIRGRRAEALTGRHGDAVRRARKLADTCPTSACSADDGHAAHCDPHRRDPSTAVWELLAELGVAGR